MNAIDELRELHPEMIAWRHDLHAHPETAFEEVRTADVIAETLATFNIEVHRGMAKTGVVGVLRSGTSTRAIGLRADMDALHIEEQSSLPYRSQHAGKMHACGHDGHTAMLLGAAKRLAATRRFDGTVVFIFQPAEENEGGGRAMVEEGLFERFPVEAVYGMHNIPGIPVGKFAAMPGPMMASFDIFEIKIIGRGTHAAMPHNGIDPIAVGNGLYSALQTIVSRNLNPMDSAVVSVTEFHAGDTWNVIPQEAVLRGTVRAFRTEVQDLIEQAMSRMCAGMGETYGATIALRYERRYPPTINAEREAHFAAQVLADTFGEESLLRDAQPLMAAEDFAFMLQAKPGAYIWIGNGVGNEGGCMVHNPGYDFNDDILPLGAAYWTRLVETALASERQV